MAVGTGMMLRAVCILFLFFLAADFVDELVLLAQDCVLKIL